MDKKSSADIKKSSADIKKSSADKKTAPKSLYLNEKHIIDKSSEKKEVKKYVDHYYTKEFINKLFS